MAVAGKYLGAVDFDVVGELLIDVFVAEAVFFGDTCVDLRRQQCCRGGVVVELEGVCGIPVEHIFYKCTAGHGAHDGSLYLETGDVLVGDAPAVGVDEFV